MAPLQMIDLRQRLGFYVPTVHRKPNYKGDISSPIDICFGDVKPIPKKGHQTTNLPKPFPKHKKLPSYFPYNFFKFRYEPWPTDDRHMMVSGLTHFARHKFRRRRSTVRDGGEHGGSPLNTQVMKNLNIYHVFPESSGCPSYHPYLFMGTVP